ncbi:MAG: aromatic ring-hydroxylating oxygenase subunit alpha, partial [Candidatus Binatia bacterium]
MNHQTQVELTRRIFHYIDTKSTAQVDSVHYNDVTTYTCPQRLAREKEILFREYPLLLGLSCQLRNPGDVLTNDDTGIPILVVRAQSGKLNAFINVCRHRGGRVVEGCGSGKRDFMCPYHGWTYNHDGHVTTIPDAESFAGLDRSKHYLVPLPIVEKYGCIWVTPKPGATIDIDAHLSGFEQDIAAYNLDSYHHYQTRMIRRKLNWKMMADTFLETYHFATLHRNTLVPIFHGNIAPFDPFGLNGRMVGVRKSIAKLRDKPEAEWNLIPHTGIVNLIFPNSVLVIQGDHIETWHAYPVEDRVDECVMYASLYAPDPITTEKAAKHWDANMDLLLRAVEQEDFPVNERILQG